jgi:hypothetical protein
LDADAIETDAKSDLGIDFAAKIMEVLEHVEFDKCEADFVDGVSSQVDVLRHFSHLQFG